ncbi:hypothetical protein RclHR1_03350012 [Rhizophagus clarus]|uniref:Uncharacterized protein n=1 Tax=Rhizophagus clarus TaxID=94130 RepID=A0A2Z6RQR3_9GLOM|nr:hypothetical protein RclHR1_03350012 [Rhizophagus clarus]GES97170.1 hypothetical protein RCL_jg7048.t1 [Rhizophagus clarus]
MQCINSLVEKTLPYKKQTLHSTIKSNIINATNKNNKNANYTSITDESIAKDTYSVEEEEENSDDTIKANHQSKRNKTKEDKSKDVNIQESSHPISSEQDIPDVSVNETLQKSYENDLEGVINLIRTCFHANDSFIGVSSHPIVIGQIPLLILRFNNKTYADALHNTFNDILKVTFYHFDEETINQQISNYLEKINKRTIKLVDIEANLPTETIINISKTLMDL